MKNMLTESQIKNLKKGDKLLAEVQFHSFSRYGALICLTPLTISKGEVVKANNYYHISCLSLPPAPPKHDPNRLFKKGDKVRYCERDGRKLFRLRDGAIYEVKSNEAGDEGIIEIWLWKDVGRYASYPYNVFELVTPVEEPKSYFVQESPHTYDIYKRDGSKLTTFYKDQPFARENADKYCASLNGEHRKEQK